MHHQRVPNPLDVPTHKGLHNVETDLLFGFLWEVGDQLQEGFQGDDVLDVLRALDDRTEEGLEFLYDFLVHRALGEALEHCAELVQNQPVELVLLVRGKVTENYLGKRTQHLQEHLDVCQLVDVRPHQNYELAALVEHHLANLGQ